VLEVRETTPEVSGLQDSSKPARGFDPRKISPFK